MFSVGQKVWHRDGQRSGTVAECDGDHVYVAQDNGVEVDFRAADLSATPPGVKPVGTRLRDSTGANRPTAQVLPGRRLVASDITPEHVRVLGVIPVRAMQAVAVLFERRPRAGKFSALDVAAKLNVIEEIAAVPYRILREYSDRPGEIVLLMGKGLADSRKMA